ncbi:Muskelin 1, intracellular mediator containing kelch motif, partial [Coemansia sp. RSA 2049]
YVDHEYRGNTGLENDLYCYDTQSNEWLVLSENTEAMDGPKLLFNTQMVVDALHRRIYVYGGKVVLPDANDSTIVYSGLYCFDLCQHKWSKLKPDIHMMEQEQHVR